MLISSRGSDQFGGSRLRVFLTGSLLLLAVLTANGADSSDASQTIAVIADRATQGTGVPDLLTVELGQVEGLQTVERAAIRSIVREQTLATALTAAGAAERLELGQLLKADLLVFLRVTRSGTEQYLHCSVSETSVGARLRQAIFTVDDREPDRIAVDCREVVEDTWRHFRAGITQLIAVLPFVSQNLVHDYDSLQSAYPTLLRAALMRIPGVGVLEIEEARSIRRELELTGGELQGRRVPLLVDGTYRIDRDDGTVSLQVSLLDGAGTQRRVVESGLNREETIDLLSGRVVSELLDLAESDEIRPLTRKAQFDALADRASLLSGVAEYAMALSLREAALLINPDSFSQRVNSLYDNAMLWKAGPFRNWRQAAGSQQTDQERLEELQPRLDSMRRGFGHLEFLVAHQMINLREATILLISLNGTTAKVRQAKHPETDKYVFDEWRPVFWRIAEHCLKLDPTHRDGTVHPLIWRLAGSYNSEPTEEWSHQAQFDLFWGHAGRMLLAKPSLPTARDFDWNAWRVLELRRLMPILVSQPMLSAAMVRRFAHLDQSITFNRPTPWFFAGCLVDESHTAALHSAATEFVKEGGQTSIYGQWILLGLELQSGIPTQRFESLRRQVQALGDRTRPHIKPLSSDTYEDRDIVTFPYELEPLLRRHAFRSDASRPGARLRPGVARPPRYGAAQPVNGKRHRPPRNPMSEVDPDPRVTFERLDIPSLWTGMLKCTDQLDVYWNPVTAVVMDQPGKLRTIYRQSGNNRNEQIAGLHWDGVRFWIVTAGSGVQLLTPDGERVGLLLPDGRQDPDDEGVSVDSGTSTRIPPYNVTTMGIVPGHEVESFLSRNGTNFGGLQIHPVEPGRCVAWGRYGPTGRLWFAEVRFDPEQDDPFEVRVFHTATRVGARLPTPAENADIRLTFRPRWRHEMMLDGRRLLLIGRGEIFGQGGRAPLGIDLESFEVRLIPLLTREPPEHIEGTTVLAQSSFGLEKYTRNRDGQSWKQQRIVINSPGAAASRGGFLTWQGSIYSPGPRWTRLEPKSLTTESLTPVAMPLRQRFRNYGISAHYGFVAWNPGDVLHRVFIDAETPPPQDTDSQFGFIPAEYREQHAKAVESIRKNGGFVDSDWTRLRGSSHVRFDGPMWKTFVYLPATWRGGDDGVAAIQDLYNLIDLYIVEAPVTDESMSHVGKVRSLQRLYLCDTEVTDAGLKELWDLRRLSYIRLDGPAGSRHFSDAGLDHLAVLPINVMTLYGPGFTEDSLKTLPSFRVLRAIHAVDTGISLEAQQKLRINGKPVHWTPGIPVSNMY